MIMITSTANPRIKEIHKLQQRKERAATGLAFIEGLRIVIEAFERGADFDCLLVCKELLVSQPGMRMVEQFSRDHEERVVLVNEVVFRYLSGKDGPQGLAAVIRQQWTPLAEIIPAANELLIGLDEVADPGNLGTIIRTADAAGVKAILLLDNCTDPYDPTSLRACMGALFNMRIVKCATAEFARWKQQNTIEVIGASDAATEDYHYSRYPQRMVLLMGSERQGLTDTQISLCDRLVAIPMLGCSDSLNLAMATGIIMYEIINHWRDQQ